MGHRLARFGARVFQFPGQIRIAAQIVVGIHRQKVELHWNYPIAVDCDLELLWPRIGTYGIRSPGRFALHQGLQRTRKGGGSAMNKDRVNPMVLQVAEQFASDDANFDAVSFSLLAQELFSYSDRAAVIVGAVQIQGQLEGALRKYTSVQNASKKGFNETINLARRHGIVHNDVRLWLHDLRELRNVFSHQMLLGIDLDDPMFADRIDRLTCPGRPSRAYCELAVACGGQNLSAAQTNVRIRIVAYSEKIRRALVHPKYMPIRWIQPVSGGGVLL